MEDEGEEQESELEIPEEPSYAFNLKLIKLTGRVTQIEEGIGLLADNVNIIHNKVNELIEAKVNKEELGEIEDVNPEEDQEPEVNNDIEEVNHEKQEVNKTKTVEHPKFTNEEESNTPIQQGELTNTQVKVLELIKKGLSNKEIADSLGLSRVGVWKSRKRLTKLGLTG